MISTIPASNQTKWQSTLMKIVCIDTQRRQYGARDPGGPVDICSIETPISMLLSRNSLHHFHEDQSLSAPWPDVSAIPFYSKKECLNIILVVVPQLLYTNHKKKYLGILLSCPENVCINVILYASAPAHICHTSDKNSCCRILYSLEEIPS